ncbi:hypothetical protein DESUT3_03800 [Desulfuromonas versatilis]|uniref:PilY1 beta-propeller domain-containing protein n=2 Tax=Desulfuromonas versatilis TaxID=2802975 RepID=A0ABM9SDC7_9BACT|nr:hypothetical protein DESUT3_03800 [Desulfuromonas versatilis]
MLRKKSVPSVGTHKRSLSALVALLILILGANGPSAAAPLPECESNRLTNYSDGFAVNDFDSISVGVDGRGHLELETGRASIDPNQIVIPFEQEVWVRFLHEDAGYRSTLGWVLKTDAVDENGAFLGWNRIPAMKKHPIFRNIADGSRGGDGVLDQVAALNESQLKTFDDGTGLPFVVDADGAVTPRDMRKSLGIFPAGAELVFFLASDRDYTTNESDRVLFTKKEWNPDRFTSCSTYLRNYDLGAPSAGDCSTTSKGWLDANAISRLNLNFGLNLSGTYSHSVTANARFDHVIVGAPDNDPNQWILGWEDIPGGGDMDFNDTSFLIERKTGGSVRLKPELAITPATDGSYFTGVSFEVYDYLPGEGCTGETDIKYSVSIDNGDNWIDISRWDQINSFIPEADGSKTLGPAVIGWAPGTPEYSVRRARIDFSGLGLVGSELTWKAELTSNDEGCAPRILDVSLDGSVANHTTISRAAPVAMANLLYSGSFETPHRSWVEKTLRGHVRAVRRYDPLHPATTSTQNLWDAGERLNNLSPADRTIYTPATTVTRIINESLELTKPDGSSTRTGDGVTMSFGGRLAHAPALATTVEFSADGKKLVDIHNGTLESAWGSGSIKRFTGEFEIVFDQPPPANVPITASYTYYQASGLRQFTRANLDNAALAMDASQAAGRHVFDLDGDGDFDQDDGDWLVEWVRGFKNGTHSPQVQKEWKLGPIDHSSPALLTPPGTPPWYYGTDVTNAERTSFDTFINAHQQRPSVLFVGSRDGMLHAFDAGQFRWGDNPLTLFKENRGFFLWENVNGINQPDYGTGDELWAFIPANLVARLKNNLLGAQDQAYVDASPALADVFIDGQWKSVLLSAEGNGGDTIFCLDVTDPLNPTLLWEFADPELFRSRSSPSVAQIGRILDSGTARWAAFFVSGKTSAIDLYPSIYILDVADGTLIQRIYLDSDPAGIGGVPSGQPAVVDSDGNGYIDRLYIGTDKGRLYKVNLADNPVQFLSSPVDCVINSDFSDNASGTEIPLDQRWHPIYASPAVVTDNALSPSGELEYNIRIFFGTGDSPYADEDINTGNTTYHFFAYNDKAAKETCGPGDVELDWFYALPAGQRVFASAFASAGQVYFGTASSETENPCDGTNEGQLLAFKTKGYDATSLPTPLFAKQTGDITTSPLVDDEHLYVRTPSGTVQVGGGGFNNRTKVGGLGKATTRAWKAISE